MSSLGASRSNLSLAQLLSLECRDGRERRALVRSVRSFDRGSNRNSISDIKAMIKTCRTRARKAISDGNEPTRETTVVSLSVDSESEDMSAVSSTLLMIYLQ
ncbi:hypothetical protein YC2023_072550 [Brassica napus]